MKKKFRLPANLEVNKLNIALTGERGTSKLLKGVVLLYNYILSYDTNTRQEEYIQVSRTILQAFLGKEEYVRVINLLLAKGFLERLGCDENGWTGPKDKYLKEGFYIAPNLEAGIVGRCKSYRIPEKLNAPEKKYQWIELELTKTEANKLDNLKKNRAMLSETYRDFICANMEKVRLIDTPESRATINKLFSQASLRVSAERYLEAWNNPLIFDTPIDAFGFRVHSQLTTAPRELRPYMRFDTDMTEELVEVDFVASQPNILASITPKLIMRFAPECKAALPFFKSIEGSADWERYKAICANTEEGEGIYNHLAKEFNSRYGTELVRDDGKDIFYRACFGNYTALNRFKLATSEAAVYEAMLSGDVKPYEKAVSNLFSLRSYHLFKEEFEDVHSLFKSLKDMKLNIEGEAAQHANNCLIAQRIESGLVYTCLVKALTEAGITKVVTIHDALFLRKCDEARARAIIQKELNKLKLNLKLKTKKN